MPFSFQLQTFLWGGEKIAAVSKKEHVITIKGCVVLYQKVAFKPGKG